jgi:hypothetical protein
MEQRIGAYIIPCIWYMPRCSRLYEEVADEPHCVIVFHHSQKNKIGG